jgi:hypothetical protein
MGYVYRLGFDEPRVKLNYAHALAYPKFVHVTLGKQEVCLVTAS